MAPDPESASGETPASTDDNAVAIPHRQRPPLAKVLLDQYVTRDWIHAASMVENKKKESDILSTIYNKKLDYQDIRHRWRDWFTPSRLYGEGYNGYGNGHTDGQPGLLYPVSKRHLGDRRTPPLKVKRKDMKEQADQVEELVPIRLDVDWEKIKLRDTFTWNLQDRTVPLQLFAETLVEDFRLESPAAERVLEQVKIQLYDQLNDFFPPVYFEEDALDPELPYSAYKNDEMRILIKLNITIGQHTLMDQFEWEINNPLNSPEEFALSMSRELSLSGEFTTAIAHCIREQSQLFTRSLYIIGHPFDGRPIEDADLVAAFLPSPLPSPFRAHQQAKEFAPYLYELSDADLERNEVIFSREQRRQKRSVNRRGGPSLPDLKDRQRTVRTLIVSSVLPGAAENMEQSSLYKRITGLTARGKRGATGALGGESESSESEDSQPDSPALSQQQGTARTRNMRGAATAAQQRMAQIGRSETPEAAVLHHHETRTSARRFGGREVREESLDGNPTLVVKLRVGREKLRQLARDWKNGVRPSTGTPSRSHTAMSPSGSMGPTSTPIAQNSQLGPPPTSAPNTANLSNAPAAQLGRVDAPPPPPPGQPLPPPPDPPQWLNEGLEVLNMRYPNDRFEGTMRYSAVDKITDVASTLPSAGQPIPPNLKFIYAPRIRCNDCPGKLYTPGPGTTVENFVVHLDNRQHRAKVDARVAREGLS